MPDPPHTSSEAWSIIQDAADRIQDVVTPDDFTIFRQTTLQDVEDAARHLEQTLAGQQKIPNTGRLVRLFRALERYIEGAHDLWQDATFSSLLWAPVRLTLELTKDSLPALSQLISAYKRIAMTIPLFDHASEPFRTTAEYQQILAMFYSEVLDFHGRVYVLLHRPGWAIFFDSTWESSSKPRLECMLESLSRYKQLFLRKASLFEVEEAKDLSEQKVQDLIRAEEERRLAELNNVHSWLAAAHLDQDDELDKLQTRCHEDSCDWLWETAKVKSWIRQGLDHSVLWLKGKPGSGKSVLCAKLIEFLSETSDTTLLYFFCTDTLNDSRSYQTLLRALLQQITQRNTDLCAYLERHYINKGLKPSIKYLKEVLRASLLAFKSVRIIVDGIDECSEREQKLMIIELLALTTPVDNSTRNCKILLSSQDVISISRSLRGRSTIDLSHERVAIHRAISSFVSAKIAESPLFSNINDVDQKSLKLAENTLVNKADGMFLWVQLVIAMLEQVYSPQQMQEALDDLPNGLDKIYEKLLVRIRGQTEPSNRDMAYRIFQWLVCSQRPLKKYEIQDAVTLHQDNTSITEETRVNEQVLELCKPLVETGTSEVIRLVHISVKEYLLKNPQHFESITAQYNATFSCLLYLMSATTLIDDQYDDKSRLEDVCKGFHGFCSYASRYWIEHLLAYLKLATESQDEAKQKILDLASTFAHKLLSDTGLSPAFRDPEKVKKIERQMRIDDRCKLLKGREPLYSLVLSTLEAQLSERIAPRAQDDHAGTPGHPIQRIRMKHDSLVAQLLKADSVPGLSAKALTAFKKTYSMCVLTCRFADCPRELQGFATAQERDLHERTHQQVYRCPNPECSMHRIGFSNLKKLRDHLTDFHPQSRATDVTVPNIRPFGDSRTATETTLVGTPPHMSKLVEHDFGGSDDEDDNDDDDDVLYGKVDHFATTDHFALSSTQWS